MCTKSVTAKNTIKTYKSDLQEKEISPRIIQESVEFETVISIMVQKALIKERKEEKERVNFNIGLHTI